MAVELLIVCCVVTSESCVPLIGCCVATSESCAPLIGCCVVTSESCAPLIGCPYYLPVVSAGDELLHAVEDGDADVAGQRRDTHHLRHQHARHALVRRAVSYVLRCCVTWSTKAPRASILSAGALQQ